ncbi:MAG: hypothetical protein IJP86_02550 [Synergistaceae bacterium]|nr:hypothetical protein [Synergistaceae bacterium]
MKRKVLLLLLALMIAIIPVSAESAGKKKKPAPSLPAGKLITVSAEGKAPVTAGNRAEAREAARRELARNALDMSVGSYVESVTKMSNYKLVSDKIFSQYKGLVSSMSIKDEWVDDEGMYHVTAECGVSETRLDSALGPAVIDALGNPRIMIMLKDGTARNAVQKVFEKAGYMIINVSQAQVLKDIDLEAARAAGDYSEIRAAAKNFRADVIITGGAGASVSTKQHILGQTIYAVNSSVRLEAVLADTAQVIGSEGFSSRNKAISYGEGAAKGLSSCASRAATSIVYKIAYALSGQSTTRTVKVIIRNIDYAASRRLTDDLSFTEGISGVYRRRYVNGNELELDIVSDKSADDIAGILAGKNYDITEVTGAVVEARKRSVPGSVTTLIIEEESAIEK